MEDTQGSVEKIGAVLGIICYWIILFSVISFLFMFAWNQVVVSLFLIKQINWMESMLLMIGLRSMTFCCSHNK
jgi:hypothetical protein